MNNINPHLVIASAGLATRLPSATCNGLLPKCMVSVAGCSAILRQLRYWALPQNQCHVLVLEEHRYVLNKHLADNGYGDVNVYSVPEANGSAKALAALPSHLEGKHLLIQWADIIPQTPGIIAELSDEKITIGLTSAGNCRFNVSISTNRLTPAFANNGNVVGFYSVPNFSKELLGDKSEFANCLIGKKCKSLQAEWHDFGDETKLAELEASQALTWIPTFRSKAISKLGHIGRDNAQACNYALLYKPCTPEEAKQAANWYNYACKCGLDVPSAIVVKNCGLVMSECPGKRLSELSTLAIAELLPDIISELAKLRPIEQETAINAHTASVYRDYVEGMVTERCTERLREYAWCMPDDSVNYVLNWIHKIADSLIELGPEKLYRGHGDCNFDNVLIAETGRDCTISFIDPRPGYVSWSFELGKLLYGASVWSSLANEGITKPILCDSLIVPDLKTRRVKLWYYANLLAMPAMFKHDPLRCIDAVQFVYNTVQRGLE